MSSKHTYIKVLLSALLLAPIFQLWAQNPPDISLVFYLEEHSPNGTLVGTVTGTDPNGDPLTYSIISGNGTGAFDINSTTGDIFVANESELIFEINPSFVLGVEANDGNGGVTSVEITINLIDIPLGFDKTEIGMSVYPNPVKEVLFVDTKEIQVNDPIVSLYSIGGHLIRVQPIRVTGNKLEISVKHVSAGVYILIIGSENDLPASFRILKQ